jgi:hypothetical protein
MEAMTKGPRGVHVTVGCTGPSGRVCKVRVALTVGGRTMAIKTVRIAAGHRRAIGLALDRAARRHLRTTRKLRTHLAVHQGAKTLFSRGITFHRP